MEQGQSCFFKNRIVTTGPTPVPDFILGAMTESVYYHRSPAFSEVMQEVRALLPTLFGTKEEVLLFSGTGTLAMEGAIANFFNVGDTVVAVNSGKFGSRWVDQARIYGCNVVEIFVERGQAVKVTDVEKALSQNKNVRGILIHASETSTGVRHPVKEIAKLAQKEKDCLCLVDAVTATGVFSVPMDAWGLDVVVAGSQKGLMLPPGLSFGAVSPRAWERTQSIKNVRYYLDWRKEKKALLENSGAFTSAVTLIGGLREVLKYYQKVGIENVYKKNWKLCFATRAAIQKAGLSLFVKEDAAASAACTALMAGPTWTSQLRQKFGLTVSGGQDELKGKIVRIGHLGYIDGWDVAAQLLSIGEIAKAEGQKIDSAAMMAQFFAIIGEEKDFTPGDLK